MARQVDSGIFREYFISLQGKYTGWQGKYSLLIYEGTSKNGWASRQRQRNYVLSNQKPEEKRTVKHLELHQWFDDADGGDSSERLARVLIDVLGTVEARQSNGKQEQQPVLVNCM